MSSRLHQPNTPSVVPRLAVVTAAATLLLIFVCGLVTNTGSALAVPDWPTTFGHNMFLYPWSQMVGGVFYEHSHRLIGSAVGMLTVALAVALWLREERRWVRRLGVVAVAAVCLQGILGGMRVVLLEHNLAILHGCVAQAFLAVIVSLTVVTSQTWGSVGSIEDPGRLRVLALLTLPAVYAQLVFGALVTHTGARLDAHLTFAVLVTLAVCLLVGRVLRLPETPAALRRPARSLLLLLALQLALGSGAFLWRFTALSAALPPALGLAVLTIHRVTGAAVWAMSVVLSLRILGCVGAPQPAQVEGQAFSGSLAMDGSRQVLA